MHTRGKATSQASEILREQEKKRKMICGKGRSVVDDLCYKIDPRPIETLP